MNVLEQEFNAALDLQSKNDLQGAIEHYKKVLNVDPYCINVYYNLAYAYEAQNDVNNAILCLLKIIEAEPKNASLYYRLGCLYAKKNDATNAIQAYDAAIMLKPDYVEACINLANLYYYLNIYEPAIKYNQKALALNPNFVEIYNNLGNAYFSTNNVKNAIEITKQGLSLFPNDERLKLNLARGQMIEGNTKEGWDYFKYRRDLNEKKGIGPYLLDYSSSLIGKTVYVYWDSGLGDTLQFVRYLHLLGELGAKILFKPQPQLESLFKENDLKAQIIPNSVGEKELNFDCQINLTSLAYLFKQNIPSKDKYLKANEEKVNHYKKEFFDNDKYKVGLVWQSSNPTRSIGDVKAFLPFSKINNVKLYSFQKGEAEQQLKNSPEKMEIVNLGKTFNDFSDTAAAIANIDMLVSVDTSVAHLAGAMGKPTCLLKTLAPDWRWSLKVNNNLWYNSINIFRQTSPDNWDTVINDVYSDLLERLKCGNKINL